MRTRRVSFLVILSVLSMHAASAQSRVPAAIRLPLTFIQSIPVTTIDVGGIQVRAIVDTTAGDADGALTLSKDVIEGAHGIGLGTAVMRDAYGRELAPLRFRMPVVTIDGHAFHDVRVVQAPASSGAGPPVPNAIGKTFLSEFLIVVDYARATVTLWPRDTRDPEGVDCGHTRIPLASTREDRLPVSAFAIDAGRVRLAWGTAASYSLLTETAAARLKLATTSHGQGSPQFYSSTRLSAAGQNIGPMEFVVLPLTLTRDFEGVLGGAFFQRHVVCIDYQRREVRIR